MTRALAAIGFRPRFSLRVLLLAVTAFAIGFPIWYRWPYEEREVLAVPGPWLQTRVTTWQRQWGGGRIKHGSERWLINDMICAVRTYENGRQHGPHLDYAVSGSGRGGKMVLARKDEPTVAGQYVNGRRNGVWTEYRRGQKQVTIWDHGQQIDP
jgi:hypothetical protein